MIKLFLPCLPWCWPRQKANDPMDRMVF